MLYIPVGRLANKSNDWSGIIEIQSFSNNVLINPISPTPELDYDKNKIANNDITHEKGIHFTHTTCKYCYMSIKTIR